jgi:four helix bundle protein
MAGARHHTEIIGWQLADRIRVEIFRLTREGTFARDFRLRSQTEDAIDSVCRNISEGFGCGSHAEFARFLEISRRSLNEFTDCLRSAELKRHVTTAQLAPIRKLITRLYPALNRFIAYLRRTDTRKTDRTTRRKGARTDGR